MSVVALAGAVWCTQDHTVKYPGLFPGACGSVLWVLWQWVLGIVAVCCGDCGSVLWGFGGLWQCVVGIVAVCCDACHNALCGL